MKKIVILLEEKTQDYAAGLFIKENLTEVLENTVQIDICFLADLKTIRFSEIDLCLVMVPRLLHKIYDCFPSGWSKEKVLLVSRTLSRDALAEINRIPSGERVLVVNRLWETTADLIQLLYELEVIHLDLVPFDTGSDPNQFRYIITAGMLNLIPNCKAKIINIGFRQLGSQAFLDIFSRLDISDSRLRQNLDDYIQKLPAKYNDEEKRYLHAQMTDMTLAKVIEKSDFGVLVTDLERHVLYCNQKASASFQTEILPHSLLTFAEDPSLADHLFREDFQHELLKIREEYVMVERRQLTNGDTPVGYYFECQTAKSIRSMDNQLSEKLRKSGFYARYTFKDIIYSSPCMYQCVDIARRLAQTSYSILIAGESGSGKEMFAQSIHNESNRRAGPFIAVNCAAFQESLLESELFGYEGGAFTGSKREGKTGLFELANKGSIFLDEIGDMPLSLQAKLLRALQEKKIMRVGSNHMIDIDIRILSASNKDLREEIALKHFRPDLYYRLSTFTITVPPLRERREDILPLFSAFSARAAKSLRPAEIQALQEYPWPGNVRELQNVAVYYDVIGSISPIFQAAQTAPAPRDAEALKEQILHLLAGRPEEGLGRGRLLALLKEQGISVSEKRFEQLIGELQHAHLITRGRGRQGIRLQSPPPGRT